eukprot:534166-Pyramimonas_sp.AAC.1
MEKAFWKAAWKLSTTAASCGCKEPQPWSHFFTVLRCSDRRTASGQPGFFWMVVFLVSLLRLACWAGAGAGGSSWAG